MIQGCTFERDMGMKTMGVLDQGSIYLAGICSMTSARDAIYIIRPSLVDFDWGNKFTSDCHPPTI